MGRNWVFYKLREWVGTVTGKGDRWGRNRVGRSEPAFLSAITIALPPPTCTARREAGPRRLAAVVLLRGRPSGGRCFFEACAGRRVRRLCPPAVALFSGLCACSPLPCQAHCPQRSSPRSVFVLHCPLFIPCAPGSSCLQATSCKLQDCPVGSCNTGLQWRPVRRFLFDSDFFFLQSP